MCSKDVCYLIDLCHAICKNANNQFLICRNGVSIGCHFENVAAKHRVLVTYTHRKEPTDIDVPLGAVNQLLNTNLIPVITKEDSQKLFKKVHTTDIGNILYGLPAVPGWIVLRSLKKVIVERPPINKQLLSNGQPPEPELDAVLSFHCGHGQCTNHYLAIEPAQKDGIDTFVIKHGDNSSTQYTELANGKRSRNFKFKVIIPLNNVSDALQSAVRDVGNWEQVLVQCQYQFGKNACQHWVKPGMYIEPSLRFKTRICQSVCI